MNNLEQKIKTVIRDVPDFPKPGIVFKDISTIMMDPKLSNEIVEYLYLIYKDEKITKIAGIESRGFLFGYSLAMRLGIPFILIRKEGKLPYHKIKQSYELEYGTATIEMHTDAVDENDSVLIHDDLLATGGTLLAAQQLIEQQGAKVYGFNCIINLSFLPGEDKIKATHKGLKTLVSY